MSEPRDQWICEDCGKEITKDEYDELNGICWECWLISLRDEQEERRHPDDRG